jgi:KRAB domain-containing zinc finger protein
MIILLIRLVQFNEFYQFHEHVAIFQTQLYVASGQFFICKLCNPSDNSNNPVEYDRHTMELHLKNEHGESVVIIKHEQLDMKHTDDFIKCDHCDLTFNKAETKSLRAHKRSHLSQGAVTTVSKNYACNMCGKKFGSVKLLGEHQNLHSGTRPFKCAYCSKDFISKYTLATHQKTHSNRPRPYKCDLCPKAFLTSHNLVQHKKLHSNIKSHVCDVCEKSFATEHNLNVHKIVHDDFKPFICRWPDCGKSFARRNEIKDHERIHTGEKPFECEVCGIKFSQRSNLLSHKKATHLNEKPHACEQCDKAFKRRRLLDYHIKACHTGERCVFARHLAPYRLCFLPPDHSNVKVVQPHLCIPNISRNTSATVAATDTAIRSRCTAVTFVAYFSSALTCWPPINVMKITRKYRL